MKPVFKTVLIYENFAAGVRARWFCARLVRALDSTLEEQMWNFDVLGIRDVRNEAASAARKADVVIVSASGYTELQVRCGRGSICGSGYSTRKIPRS
jgi:hypothetical protein